VAVLIGEILGSSSPLDEAPRVSTAG